MCLYISFAHLREIAYIILNMRVCDLASIFNIFLSISNVGSLNVLRWFLVRH